MLNTLKKIITGKTGEPEVEIEITETCLLQGKQVSPGERLTLSERDAGGLIAANRARRILSDAEEAKRERLQRLIPPAWTARELPETWQALPKPFHELWKLTERFRCAYGFAEEVEALYLRGRGLDENERRMLEQETGRTAPDGSTRSRLVEAWVAERMKHINIGILDDKKHEELRKLADAMNRAYQNINFLLEEQRENFLRLKIECGDVVLAAVHRGAKAAKECRTVGFEIFRCRLEALRLGEAELRRLFCGTAEDEKYGRAEIPSAPNLHLGWLEDSGEPRHYVEGTPAQLADFARVFSARADELEALAAEAKRELAQTRKASKAAA
jgi:hypothetical protein